MSKLISYAIGLNMEDTDSIPQDFISHIGIPSAEELTVYAYKEHFLPDR